MKSFRDPTTNILTAYGYIDSNGTDLPREEVDGFDLEPMKWRLVDGEWKANAPDINEIRADALAEIRKQRAPILNALAGIGLDALMAGDNAIAQAVAAARIGLKNITAIPALMQATNYDEMKLIVMAEYRAIAATAPVAVQKAFLEVIAP